MYGQHGGIPAKIQQGAGDTSTAVHTGVCRLLPPAEVPPSCCPLRRCHTRVVWSSTRAASPPQRQTGPRDEIWRSHHGERRNLERMIPGYTGFVPKSQNYFSRMYPETCRETLSEFDRDQQRRVRLASAIPLVSNNTTSEFNPRRLSTPLTVISKEPAPYKTMDPWKPKGSPYIMADSSPHKYFISGFTGYVPKSRLLIGTGYPITTNKALVQFGKEMRRDPTSLGRNQEPCPPSPLSTPPTGAFCPPTPAMFQDTSSGTARPLSSLPTMPWG
ncbi:hypothetical protein J4Q44_G00241620 [Coregonus suidteri]|uniref:Protein FAM166B n=1 Tax=Coregonus suidteri TaxID=861788 RepID=A0AAN8LBZ3_9TELE